MKKNSILVLIISLLFFAACYEDKGNYDYIDFNEITISDDPLSSSTVIVGEKVRLEPRFTWKYPDRDTTDNAWAFQWRMNGEIISTERILNVVPNIKGVITIDLFVTEKETGIVTPYNCSMYAMSLFDKGWLILSHKDGAPSLSFLGKMRYYYDYNIGGWVYFWNELFHFYDEMHPGEPLPATAYRSIPYFSGTSNDEILLMNESGDHWIMNDDFKRIYYLEDEFFDGYPAGFEPKQFARGGGVDFVLGTNGKVCMRENRGPMELAHVDPFIGEYIYFPQDSKIRELIPAPNSSTLVMYDELHNRILSCYSGTTSSYAGHAGQVINITSKLPDSEYIDFNNLKDYEFIYGAVYNNGNNFSIILKDPNTGKYLFQDCASNNLDGIKREIVRSNISELPIGNLIAEDTQFCRLRILPYLFFTSGSKLYFFDVDTKAIKLYTDLGNSKITSICQEIHTSGITDFSLGVGTDTGDFYTFNVQQTEVLAAPDPGAVGCILHYENLGKILDVQWKLGGAWSQSES